MAKASKVRTTPEPAPAVNGGVAVGPDLKKLLKLFYRADRPFLLEGPTGIGKSEIIVQVAAELGVECKVLNLSLLEPPDLVGLPRYRDGRTAFAPPQNLPTEGRGLLFLEELNRAERYTQNPALLLLTARRLHDYELPRGWVPCAAVNPEEGEYLVQPLDPAMRARFAYLRVRPDRAAWLEWATANAVHPAVLQLAREQPRFLETVPPRKWTDVSKTLKAATRAELDDDELLHAALAADLPPAWVVTLAQLLEAAREAPRPEVLRLLTGYHNSPELQREVRGHRDQGRTDVLDGIAEDVLELVGGPMLHQLIGNRQFDLEAFDGLIADLPGDRREKLQQHIGDNPAAAALLVPRPDEALRQYPGSRLADVVPAWVQNPCRQHRARLLAKRIAEHLERQDAAALNCDRGTLTGLGQLIAHLGDFARPLLEVSDRRGIQPAYPKSYRRPKP